MLWITLVGFALGTLMGTYITWIKMNQKQIEITEHCLTVYYESERKLALAQEYEQKADKLQAEAREFLEQTSTALDDWAAK